MNKRIQDLKIEIESIIKVKTEGNWGIKNMNLIRNLRDMRHQHNTKNGKQNLKHRRHDRKMDTLVKENVVFYTHTHTHTKF